MINIKILYNLGWMKDEYKIGQDKKFILHWSEALILLAL